MKNVWMLAATASALALALPLPLPALAQGTAAPPGASASSAPAGLVYRSIREGSGASPSASDRVKVHYRGTFPDGREFDSSMKRGEPAVFPLGGVIKCWTEGVQRMKPGGKAQLICPPQLAYGTRGAGTVIPPDATLHFEIELLEVNPR